jgi:hypothetical protein
MLNTLIELLLLSRESSLSNIVSSFEDFKQLHDIHSASINKFFQNSFKHTEMSKAITNIKWKKGESSFVFGS